MGASAYVFPLSMYLACLQRHRNEDLYSSPTFCPPASIDPLTVDGRNLIPVCP